MAGFWRKVLLGPDWDRAEHRAGPGANISIGDPALAEYFSYGSRVLAGVEVNEGTALGLTAVYRAVSIIAGTIAGLPLRAIRTLPDGSRERIPSFLDDPAGPGADMTQHEWVELVLVHLLLWGNAYLKNVYNGAGALVGLEPIHPGCVSIRRITTAEELANYGGPAGMWRRWYDVHLADGSTRHMTPAELTHIPALGTDGVKGIAPIEVHRQALGTGIAGDRAAARLFGSGMLVAGLVSADEDLVEEDAREAKRQLMDKAQGADHASEIVFMNAKLNFTPWQLPPIEAQFIESRVHQVEEVARIFGVPPHLLGQTEKQTSWGTGVEEQNRGLARYTLAPWTSRIESRLEQLLPRTTTVEFDYSGLLQPAPEVEIPLLIQQVGAGLLTVDEARRIRNMPPLPAGAIPSQALPVEGSADQPAPAGAGATGGPA